MSLTAERQLLLQDKFFEFSFDDNQADHDFFRTIDNPLEYHYIAAIYNWDDGTDVLSWIVNSPICDASTAKMIFWRAQPSCYTRFGSAEEADYEADVLALLQSIITNFEQGFYKNQQIAYDPKTDPCAEDINEPDPHAKWTIPEFMKAPLPGMEVDFW